MSGDIRNEIFKSIAHRTITAAFTADDEGMVAGTARAVHEAAALGLAVVMAVPAGTNVIPKDQIMKVSGTPTQIAIAEEMLIGFIAKPSGIATAARAFVEKAGGRMRIICGAWKKMPPGEKETIRDAIVAGGAWFRISREPFVYLDKNYTAMFGGIRQCLDAVRHLGDVVKVIQLKGRYGDVTEEARDAFDAGARILFIDTGQPGDVTKVSEALQSMGVREKVQIAFGGGITLQHIEILLTLDIDILDVGRHIVDAPLLDMRMEIVEI